MNNVMMILKDRGLHLMLLYCSIWLLHAVFVSCFFINQVVSRGADKRHRFLDLTKLTKPHVHASTTFCVISVQLND